MGLTGNTQIKFMQLHGNLPGRLVFGVPGKNGVTFTPHVSEDGILSWTNDGGLENPAPVKIPGGSADPEAIEKAIEEYLAANPPSAGKDGTGITNITIEEVN